MPALVKLIVNRNCKNDEVCEELKPALRQVRANLVSNQRSAESFESAASPCPSWRHDNLLSTSQVVTLPQFVEARRGLRAFEPKS
jgi:hypothetical protein